jgi:UrcA family protein
MNPHIHPKGFRRFSATVLCGALASNLAALPAAQAGDFDIPQATVKFGDLDLSHKPGAAVLYSRIKLAAEKVCEPHWATSLQAKVSADDCVRSAIAQAVATVDQPALSQVYSAKNRIPLPTRLSQQASKVTM